VQTKLENSYRIIFILSAVIAIAIVGFIIIANQVKVKALPFVIHGDEVVTLNLDDAPNSNTLQTQLASYFVKQFVRNARSVSVDAQINRAQEIAAYSFVSGAATQTLSDFYEKNNPNEIASNHVKSVHVTSVLRASAHTFDIRWDEELRKVDTGEVVQTQHFIAQITYQYQKPSADAVVLRSNPMGFQITQLTWSEDIQS
jgi:type IV secretion system protein VirB5